MPKMKTHKGTKKRFRVTKNGKLMRMKQGRSHLRRNKRRTADLRHAVPSEHKVLINIVKQTVANPTE
ncbi:MAG: 50S ribosomal protein L35 [Caldilineaceae bacterium]|nr:50S ribosomal protein L35 [Caldilineaceae bacterium]